MLETCQKLIRQLLETCKKVATLRPCSASRSFYMERGVCLLMWLGEEGIGDGRIKGSLQVQPMLSSKGL